MPKAHKWKRIDHLEDSEVRKLESLCKKTKGLSRFGNRARVAVMLPANLAEVVATYAQLDNVSIGEFIVLNLQKNLGVKDERN